MQKTKESGRSMVEMLGVLAIIGVLSVGGIAGYTTAMNKHRANQILNGASVRAIVVSTQIQRGSETPTLGEFTEADNAVGGAKFTGLAAWNKDTDKRFSLTLTGVSTEICAQMKASVGKNSIIKAIADDCTTITYNNDLSPNDPEPTYDDNAGAKACSSNADCDAGCQTCTDGKCISKCALGEYCVQGSSSSDYVCVGVPTCSTNDDCSTGCCSNGICVAQAPYDEAHCQSPGTWQPGPPAGDYGCFDSNYNIVEICSPEKIKGCTNNSQCDAGEYCAITAADSCTSITGGACTPLGTVNTVSGKTGNAATYNGITYNNGYINWWRATNWCKAQGKRLVSLSDLGITRPSGSSCSGNECVGADWDTLKEAFGSSNYWTNDSYSSCLAFFVSSKYQGVLSDDRNNLAVSTLCR